MNRYGVSIGNTICGKRFHMLPKNVTKVFMSRLKVEFQRIESGLTCRRKLAWKHRRQA